MACHQADVASAFPLSTLQDRIGEHVVDDHYVETHILPYINQILAEVVRGMFQVSSDDEASPLFGSSGRRCYEIIEATFVLDSTVRPWLVKVATHTEIDERLPADVKEVLKQAHISAAEMMLDRLYPPQRTTGGMSASVSELSTGMGALALEHPLIGPRWTAVARAFTPDFCGACNALGEEMNPRGRCREYIPRAAIRRVPALPPAARVAQPLEPVTAPAHDAPSTHESSTQSATDELLQLAANILADDTHAHGVPNTSSLAHKDGVYYAAHLAQYQNRGTQIELPSPQVKPSPAVQRQMHPSRVPPQRSTTSGNTAKAYANVEPRVDTGRKQANRTSAAVASSGGGRGRDGPRPHRRPRGVDLAAVQVLAQQLTDLLAKRAS